MTRDRQIIYRHLLGTIHYPDRWANTWWILLLIAAVLKQ